MRLRQIREKRGLTIQAAATLLYKSPSALSKMEAGKRGIPRSSLEYMLDRYGVANPDFRDHLIRLAEEARNALIQGWWQAYNRTLSPDALDYISLEAAATRISAFELHLIPGLLQTEAYARAIIAAGFSAGSPRVEDALVAVRMRRQDILDGAQPPQYLAIVSEAALRQMMGGQEVMRQQLRHLLAISQLDHVKLQVLPFSAGTHAGLNGSFTLVALAGSLAVVLVESITTGWYLETEDEIRRYRIALDRLENTALSQTDSRALIERLLSDL